MPPSFNVWNVSHAVFTSVGYWVSSWYMSRGQAITGMVGVGWGGVIRRKILRGVKLVGRGWGKSGFLGTCLFRRSQVLLPDFSHSTLCGVRKSKAEIHRCIFIVKWNWKKSPWKLLFPVFPISLPWQLLGTSEVLSVWRVAPQMYLAADMVSLCPGIYKRD